jgi:hypothetical protein
MGTIKVMALVAQRDGFQGSNPSGWTAVALSDDNASQKGPPENDGSCHHFLYESFVLEHSNEKTYSCIQG